MKKPVIRCIYVSSCIGCPFFNLHHSSKEIECLLQSEKRKIKKTLSGAVKKMYSGCILPKGDK